MRCSGSFLHECVARARRPAGARNAAAAAAARRALRQTPGEGPQREGGAASCVHGVGSKRGAALGV